jgi:Trm5-related predicted tRNA methylase
MVAISICLTHQPTYADWYRCGTQSVSSDTLMTLKKTLNFQKSSRGHEKPAKSLVSQSPRKLSAAHICACTHATVLVIRRISRLDLPRPETPPAIVFAVCGGVVCEDNKSACMTGLTKAKTSTGARACITVM